MDRPFPSRQRSCYLLGLLDHAMHDVYAAPCAPPETVSWHTLVDSACHYGAGVRPQEFDSFTADSLLVAGQDYYRLVAVSEAELGEDRLPG